MKKFLLFLTVATGFILAACNKSDDERITYLLDDSKIVYATGQDGYAQYLNFRNDCNAVMTDVTYTYKSKQTELISKLDAVVDKYQNKYLAGDLILYTTYATSSDKAVIKSWTIKPNGVVIEFVD